MNEIVNLIGNVGFPISAFLLMWYQNYKLNEIIDKNTEALINLKNSIDKIGDKQ